MDDRLERIENKWDSFYKDYRDYKEETNVRLSKIENDIKNIKACNGEQDKEIKPLSNVRWLFIQIPSIVAVVASLIAIIKVFGKIP